MNDDGYPRPKGRGFFSELGNHPALLGALTKGQQGIAKKVYLWYISGMNFEYDPAKSETNKIKHGLDFEEAKALWQDENLLVVLLNFADEPRKACIGKIGEKCWTAIITCREKVVRIISVRRARKDEEEAYER